jgi:hypothetical protein
MFQNSRCSLILTTFQLTPTGGAKEAQTLAVKFYDDFYELVSGDVSEMMEGDSAKHVSEKMEEGWILMLETMVSLAKDLNHPLWKEKSK